ncbi:MAG: hypothetical protein KIS86_05635 [Devosia sp.]|nr:hypothetical protein [Devosia sp.]
MMMVRFRIAVAYFADPATQALVRNGLGPLAIAEARFEVDESWSAQVPALVRNKGNGKTLCVLLTPSDEQSILSHLLASEALRVEVHDIEG